MKHMRLLLGIVAILTAATPQAQAITAWARKYGVDCNVCHVAGYKLTGTGQKFVRLGHRMPTPEPDKEMRLSEHLAMTSKIRVWGKWTKVDQQGVEKQKTDKSSFEVHALSLYAGGPLDNGFSYFSEFYLHENEKKFTPTASETNASDMGDWGRSKLAESYLQYNKTLGEDAFVTARVGRIMPWLVHFHGGGARLEYSRPLPLTSTSSTDNPYRPFARQYGASAGVNFMDAFLEVGVTNGTGKHENIVEVENDKHKDVFATLDYSFDANGSMLGAYYYKGYWPGNWLAKTGGGIDFYQYGLMGNYTFNITKDMGGAFIAAAFTGNDRYRAVAAGSPEMNHRHLSYYVEGQAHLMGDVLAPYVRWEYFDVDKARSDNEKWGPVLGVSWKALDHGRFVLEYSRYITRNTQTKRTTDGDLTLELQYMF